jgi:hypothetical protein
MNFDLNYLDGASLVDRISSFANTTLKNVASDKDVKAELVSKAITSITGIAPIVDRRNPEVTWVRLLPSHGEFFDTVFMAQAKKISKGPSAGEAANMKIDVAPAIKPILFKRVLPLSLLVLGSVFFSGFALGKRSK